MSNGLHRLTLPGPMLERGFWLYVWEVNRTNGVPLYYVGRTGDNSSPHASAPYTRMGQHLGTAKNQNALRRQLGNRNVELADCIDFELVSHGPIYPEIEHDGADRATLFQRHVPFRNQVGAMEKLLCDGMKAGGYDVMNTVNCSWQLDNDGIKKWATAKQAFKLAFPDLE